MSSNASASRAAIRLQSSSSEGSTVSSEARVRPKRSGPDRCYNFPTCLTKEPEHSFTRVVTRLVFASEGGDGVSVVNGLGERAVQRSRKLKNKLRRGRLN